MVNKIPFSCTAEDGLEIKSMRWKDDSMPLKAVVVIVHGMQEYCMRYDDFASFLSSHGIYVFSFDIRGHGQTTPDIKNRGFFAVKNGIDLLMSDVDRFFQKTREIMTQEGVGDLPVYVLGHSMGSFITSCYVKRTQAQGLQGIILSGTTVQPGPVGLSRTLARLQATFLGAQSEAKFINKLAFGTYNKRCIPQRTPYDWISRDEAIVDKYKNDPACTFIFKAAGFADLFGMIEEIGSKNWTARIPADVPIYLFAGDADPVGQYGKGPLLLCQWYKETGHNVQLKLYPQGRHEMLNEINRQEVYEDVLHFIQTQSGFED